MEPAPGSSSRSKGRRHWPVTFVVTLAATLGAVVLLPEAYSAKVQAFVDDRLVSTGVMYTVNLSGPTHATLPDGTLVEQNIATTSQARVSRKARSLAVSPSGEVIVNVSPSRDVPFVIHAGRIDVHAGPGIVWVRSLKAGGWRVGTLSGSTMVRYMAGGIQAVPLRAGDIATFGPGSVFVAKTSSKDFERYTAWRQSEIWLDGETLAEVAAEFNRYNERKLIVSGQPTASVRIGGRFHTNDVDKFVKALEPLGVSSRVIRSTPPSQETIQLFMVQQ
jgi:transmembrane sensor